MTIKLAKDSIDLGIVTTNMEAMIGFYRDVLGFQDDGEIATRATVGGLVRLLRCGTSTVKLIKYATPPPVSGPVGGINAATGYRYWIIHVTDLEEIVAACERAHHTVVRPIKHIGAGIRVAMVEDPDGNWVEFMSNPDLN